MSEITDIPVEMQIKILDYLDYESMKNACLACKDWNAIILSSKKFINSTKIVIGLMDLEFLNSNNHLQMTKISRMSNSLVLDGHKENIRGHILQEHELKQIVGVINEFSEPIASLTIQKFTVNCYQYFNQIIQACSNLKELELKEIMRVKDAKELESEMNCIKNLDKLIINDFGSLLEQMEMRHRYYCSFERKKKSLQEHTTVECLNKIEGLNTLIIRRISLFSGKILTPKFNWNHLKVIECDDLYANAGLSWENLINAAALGAKASLDCFNARLTGYLMEKIRLQRNITQMKIDLNYDMVRIICCCEREDKFNHLKILKIRKRELKFDKHPGKYEKISEKCLNFFMEKFPNVKLLDISSTAAQYLFSVFENHDDPSFRIQGFHAVKKLKINKLRECNTMKRVMTFPSLETLEIVDSEYSDIAEIGDFGKRNETLRHVIIINYKSPINLEMWMHCSEIFPTAQRFDVTDALTRGKHVRTREEIELMIMKRN